MSIPIRGYTPYQNIPKQQPQASPQFKGIATPEQFARIQQAAEQAGIPADELHPKIALWLKFKPSRIPLLSQLKFWANVIKDTFPVGFFFLTQSLKHFNFKLGGASKPDYYMATAFEFNDPKSAEDVLQNLNFKNTTTVQISPTEVVLFHSKPKQ